MTISEIKNEIQNWDKQKQAVLMHFLVELLAGDKFELSKEWDAEIDRREKALEDGSSVGRSAREVLAKYTARR